MVLGSEVDSPAIRYGLYIDELQEFFAGRGMHFGSPDDLFRLAARLAEPSFFQDEMSSMVRAIIYRESEGIRREELLELVAVATAGPYVDLSSPRLQEPIRQLLSFFSGVLRSLWRTFPREPEESAAGEPEHDLASAEAPAALPLSASAPSTPLIEADADALQPAPAPAVDSVPAPDPADDVFSRARAALDRAAQPPRAVAPVISPPHIQPVAVPVIDPVRQPRSATRRSVWIVGICGLLLGLAAGLSLRVWPFQPAPDSSTPASKPAHQVAALPDPGNLPIRDTRLPPETPRSRTVISRSPAIVAGKRYLGIGQPVPHPPTGLANSRSPEPAAAAQPVPPLPSLPSMPQTTVSSPDAYMHPYTSEPSQAVRLNPIPLARGEQPAAAYSFFRPSVSLSSSGVMAANLLYAPAPEYPREAVGSGVEGRVVLQALVWRDGSVAVTRVLRGDRLLGAAAENAVRRWHYRPYIVDGQPTDVSTIITVDFHLLR